MFLDGREWAADLNPSWMGHSKGRWDGDRLVAWSVLGPGSMVHSASAPWKRTQNGLDTKDEGLGTHYQVNSALIRANRPVRIEFACSHVVEVGLYVWL